MDKEKDKALKLPPAGIVVPADSDTMMFTHNTDTHDYYKVCWGNGYEVVKLPAGTEPDEEAKKRGLKVHKKHKKGDEVRGETGGQVVKVHKHSKATGGGRKVTRVGGKVQIGMQLAIEEETSTLLRGVED